MEKTEGMRESQVMPLVLRFSTTVECRFLEPPRETKIGSRKRQVREIGGKIAEKFIKGKIKLVREIGIPLYSQLSRKQTLSGVEKSVR